MDALMLGPLVLREGEKQVALGDLQQRFTLATLLLHPNRPISLDRLVATVWNGQEPPKTSANLIQGYIANLRKAFQQAGAPVTEITIVREPNGYVLHIDENRIDAVRFTRLVKQAKAASRADDRRTQATLLTEAVGLWRGRYLEDLDIDRVGAADIVSPEEQYYDALGDLAELELAEDDHRAARDRLHPIVAATPNRERLVALLMRALIANGDRAQALDTYHRTKDVVREESGLEPSNELRQLARLAQDEQPTSGLPRPLVSFTGRTDQLRTITDSVRAADVGGRAALVWISGMPGVGKSALALHAAHELRTSFPDGQIVVQLNGFTPNVALTSDRDAAGALLEGLGVPPEQLPRSTAARIDMYHSRLLGTRTLVLLDNAVSEDQVRDLLPTAPGCAGLVTSRRAGGVDAGEGIRLDPLTEDEAIALFRRLVGRVRVRYDMADVARVVEHCARMPLQIRVVASQFHRHLRWPIGHLLALLADAGPWRAGSELAREGLAAWSVSYQQLSDAEQALFRLFGQLPGPDASIAATAALAHCTVSSAQVLLEELHSASLLEEHVPERYLMLDPLKEYASTGLRAAQPGESVEAIDRWLDHHLVTAWTAMRVAFPVVRDELPELHRASPVVVDLPDGQAAREWLAAERANLLAAVRFAAAHDRPEHTWQLAVVLWRWYAAQGMVADWLETLELALRTLDVTGTDRHGLAYVLLRLAGGRWQSGEPHPAQALAVRALSLWTEIEDVRGQAWALAMIALLDMELTDNRAATEHYEAALERYEQVGDQRGRANTLSNLGRLNELSGRLDIADAQHSDAITLLEEMDYAQGLAHALGNRGVTRQQIGRLTDAMADYRRARVLAHEVGDRRSEAYTVNNIANVHRLLGQFDDALREHTAARELADTVTDPTLRSQLYIDRGATFYAKGDYSQALNAYFSALDLIGGGHVERDKRPDAEHGAAQTLHRLGRHNEAAEHWQAAIDSYAELERPESAEVRGELARLSCPCVGGSEPTGWTGSESPTLDQSIQP